MKLFLILLISAVLLLLLFLAFAAYHMYRFAIVRKTPVATVWEDDALFFRFRRMYEKCPARFMEKRDAIRAIGQRGEKLTLTSHDGLKLSARLILPDGEIKAAAVMLHGYRSEPTHDFGPLACDLLKLGVLLLIPDQRAHGGSEGKHITFGVMERYDALLWTELLAERFPGVSIFLFGVSMGAATVLAASELPLPPRVSAVIADCGYTSPADICEKVLTADMHLPKFPLFPVSKLAIRLFAGFSLDDISVLSSVKRTHLPSLIFHGEKDGFVPFGMGEAIRDAAGEKCTFVPVADADHGESYLYAANEYLDTIRCFLNGVGIDL